VAGKTVQSHAVLETLYQVSLICTFTCVSRNTTNSAINLESIFFVEMAREYGERNVDDNEGEYCGPDCNVFDQLLSKVVEHSGEVNGVDWGKEPGAEAAE